MHWVSAAHAVPAEVRLYDRLFTKPDSGDVEEGQDWKSNLNPDSLEVLDRLLGRGLARRRRARGALPVRAPRLLLRRPRFNAGGRLVFNRTVTLRDTWAKIEGKQKGRA